MLGLGGSLLSTHRLLGDARGAAVATFVLSVLVAMCADYIVAGWREGPMVLGPLELLGIASTSALVGTAAHRLGQRALAPPRYEPRRLAAAVQRELQVADDRRAQVERLEVLAMRAFWLVEAGSQPWLLLDCAQDGWVLLAPPVDDNDALVAVNQRFTIERLRWTHAVVSVTSHGSPLHVQELSVSRSALADLAPCEVRSRGELPIEVHGALGLDRGGYRS